jgi:hypothetical protein
MRQRGLRAPVSVQEWSSQWSPAVGVRGPDSAVRWVHPCLTAWFSAQVCSADTAVGKKNNKQTNNKIKKKKKKKRDDESDNNIASL